MNNGKPEVAVILVNYNSLNDTLDCLASLQNSTVHTKSIVVDNASKNAAEVQMVVSKNFSGTEIFINNHLRFCSVLRSIINDY